MALTNFSEISLLITVYNRSSSLERLLKSFADLGIKFGEIVVSDDGSSAFHLSKMDSFISSYGIMLIKTEHNRGLGNNLNKGQAAVTKPFTLYVQEDFIPKKAASINIDKALKILKSDQSIDTIRFYSYFPYPYTNQYNSDFKQMIFKSSISYWNHLKFYMYSDHPHLRRSNFNEKFGKYPEGIPPDKTEFEMCLSYIKKKGKGLIINDYNETFDQKNNSDEPSTIGRKSWKEKDNVLIKFMRSGFLVYRFLKNSVQLRLKD
ncbi:glycosyltransferase [Pedobacter sp. MC2016-24]|uniref:glycosyltransferase n=1 Tax=Pedobacter sp. MC2016-24 TaxID=2780090 RepID=UPI0018801F47|nr:glycosyltransferase [Pedobacter sp. MC2016-24]MBE9602493.1 glycosyltransferase [Pedobacter sp. MC2016-24]